ncbi:zf-HC2 domain-containing protein [candidate division KSB1 bacterium]|nr:zf-HC2 domain-containing protein [candidate division KSB1 bacterium]RQW11474.1 MAG: hypothetical protein EH222_00505 [candidate division KSB1 bacterium]
MKNCDYYRTLFSDYIDAELDAPALSALKAHLDGCAACAQSLRDMQAVKSSLASLPPVKTSESFDLLLQARLRRETRQTAKSRRFFPFFELNWRTPAYAAAALCLIFFGSLLQRFASSSYSATSSDTATLLNALRNDIAVEPGYMVFVELDTVNNRYRIINYAAIDNMDSRKEFQRTGDDMRALPNLRDAPQNEPVLIRTSSQSRPRVRQAEFIF